jgi:hypothetical protein
MKISRRMLCGGEGGVAMGEGAVAYSVLERRPDGRRPLVTPTNRLQIIKKLIIISELVTTQAVL